MDSAIVVAIIAGGATVTTAVVAGLMKAKDNGTSTALPSKVDANEAPNKNWVTQLPNHNVPSQAIEPFSGKIATNPSLIEIAETLQAAKPYDKIQIAKNYAGLRISWPVVFSSIRGGENDDDWYVSFDSPEKHFLGVSAYIEIEKYPKLKVIDRRHPVWIEGQIESASSVGVHLKPNPEIVID